MGQKSELFSVGSRRVMGEQHTRTAPRQVSRRDLIEIVIVFALILIAVWTRPGHGQLLVSLGAMAGVIGIALAGKWSPSALGLTKPLAGAGYILLAGALACGGIALIGIALRRVGPGYA